MKTISAKRFLNKCSDCKHFGVREYCHVEQTFCKLGYWSWYIYGKECKDFKLKGE